MLCGSSLDKSFRSGLGVPRGGTVNDEDDEDEDEEMPEASEGVPDEVTREMLVQFYAKHDPTKVDKVDWPRS